MQYQNIFSLYHQKHFYGYLKKSSLWDDSFEVATTYIPTLKMIQKQSLRSDSKVFQNSLQPEHIFRVTESPLFVTVIMKTNSTTLLHKLLPSYTDIAILKPFCILWIPRILHIDWGMQLHKLYIPLKYLLGEGGGWTLPLFSVFMDRVYFPVFYL